MLVDVKTVIANLLKGTGHLWFLPMIFANFCLLKIFQPAIDKYPITSFICSLALYFGCSVLNVAFLNVVFHYLPFIILGYLLYGKTNIIEKYSFLLLFLWFCVFIVYLFDIILKKGFNMRRFIVDVIDDKVEITSEIVKHAKVILIKNLKKQTEY